MLRIIFEYKDRYTNGSWKRQSCTVTSVDKCIELYGLNDHDVDYHFISVVELDESDEVKSETN